jgi:hypothetical protein
MVEDPDAVELNVTVEPSGVKVNPGLDDVQE